MQNDERPGELAYANSTRIIKFHTANATEAK